MDTALLVGVIGIVAILLLATVPFVILLGKAKVRKTDWSETTKQALDRALDNIGHPDPEKRDTEQAFIREIPGETTPTGVFSCEQCGRPAGREMISCPERPRGNCLYRKANLMPFWYRLLGAGVLYFTVVWLVGWTTQPEPELAIRVLGALLIGPLFVSVSLYLILGMRTQLHSPVTGLKWNRNAIFGISLAQTVIARAELLKVELEFDSPLQHPYSVTQLAHPSDQNVGQDPSIALALFRAAVLTLLSRGSVQIARYQQYSARRNGELKPDKSVYVLTLDGKAELSSVPGGLEQAIILGLVNWPKNKLHREWPDGPPVYEITRAVITGKTLLPSLVSYVEDDAIKRGLGKRVGTLKKRFEYLQSKWGAIRREREAYSDLLLRLEQSQPDFCEILDREITRAFNSLKQDPPDFM